MTRRSCGREEGRGQHVEARANHSCLAAFEDATHVPHCRVKHREGWSLQFQCRAHLCCSGLVPDRRPGRPASRRASRRPPSSGHAVRVILEPTILAGVRSAARAGHFLPAAQVLFRVPCTAGMPDLVLLDLSARWC